MNLSQRVLLRRVDILAALGDGHTQAEVAEIIGVSIRTVQRVVSLDRLRAAIPPGQVSDAIRAALAEEKNRRRRARLLHDLALLTIDEARTLRRTLRSNRQQDLHAPVEQGGESRPVVGLLWQELDESPESLETIKAAAGRAISMLRGPE